VCWNRLSDLPRTFIVNGSICSGASIPNPVKIVRRLTALEFAIVQLQKDCATIAKKRNDIVLSVVSKQNQNVKTVEKVSSLAQG
jgi:hypothetical protein